MSSTDAEQQLSKQPMSKRTNLFNIMAEVTFALVFNVLVQFQKIQLNVTSEWRLKRAFLIFS